MGTGKSSLLPESLFWCLWGETARDIPVDKVINRTAKRDCSVTTVLLAGNRKLEVTRYRKHSQLGGDGLRLIVDGRDCTEGTPRLTQQLLNAELGVDFVTFSSVLAFSPDTLRFVSNTDANQKQVLDAILQTRRFTAAQEVAKKAHSITRDSYQADKAEYDKARSTLEELQSTLAEYTIANADWASQETARVAELNEKVLESQETCKNAQANIEHLQQRKATLEASRQSIDDVLEDVDEAQGFLNAAIEMLSSHKALLNAKQSELDTVQEDLDTAVDMAGKPCPTCGQEVSNTGKLIAAYQKKRNRLDRELKSMQATLVQLTENKTKASDNRSRARTQQEEIREIDKNINRTLLSITEQQGVMVVAQNNIKTLQQQIKTVPVNAYDELIPRTRDRIDTQQERVDSLNGQFTKGQLQMGRLQFWVDAFGNSGIRSFLLDQIIPQLTEYANGFTAKLGENLQIQFQTHKEGAATDRFTIQAFNEDGADLYKGNSSGEKRRVDIAIMLGLFRIAYNRTRFNVLLLDEALDTLDTAGLECVVDLLRDLARELNLTIYVTSHTELSNYLEDKITLVKQGGQTTLVG
jgi:DNA repair exonuclease SbcCD ATPase subunit